jgi:hypothetical protein
VLTETKTNQKQGEKEKIMEKISVETRLGNVLLEGRHVAGSPFFVPASSYVLKKGKQVLPIPQGAVLIPRRYGPKRDGRKLYTVMQVYPDVFSALRSRYGVFAFYGRPGRGKICSAQRVVQRMESDAVSCQDSTAAARLEELADRFSERTRQTAHMFSRLDSWTNALMEAVAEEEKNLRALRAALDAFRHNLSVSRSYLRGLAEGLHFNPFVGLTTRILWFVGYGHGEILFATSSDKKQFAVDDFIDEIDGFLLRCEFEEILCLLKEAERSMNDDASRALSLKERRHHVQRIVSLIPLFYDFGKKLRPEINAEKIETIADALRTISRGVAEIGLTIQVISLVSSTRSFARSLGESIG